MLSEVPENFQLGLCSHLVSGMTSSQLHCVCWPVMAVSSEWHVNFNVDWGNLEQNNMTEGCTALKCLCFSPFPSSKAFSSSLTTMKCAGTVAYSSASLHKSALQEGKRDSANLGPWLYTSVGTVLIVYAKNIIHYSLSIFSIACIEHSERYVSKCITNVLLSNEECWQEREIFQFLRTFTTGLKFGKHWERHNV